MTLYSALVIGACPRRNCDDNKITAQGSDEYMSELC